MYKNKKIARIIVYSPLIFIALIALYIILFIIHEPKSQLSFILIIAILMVFVYFVAQNIWKQIESYTLGIAKNEQELRANNEVLSDMLYVDYLTKLPNKKFLQKQLETIKAAKIILLDIDSFHNINDYYGSDVGDLILLEITKYLQDFIKDTKMQLFRIGADQFALLEDESLDIEKYEDIAQELVKKFKSKEIEVVGVDYGIEISCTIGFALEEEKTLSKAFVALNYAKKTQRDYVCYMKNLDSKESYAQRVKWSNFIKEAIKNDQVVPYFQPIFDIHGKVNKYECLARILNEKEEVISPGLFIETSKDVRQYAKIAKVLIDKAFSMISKTDKSVSFNLLARDMSDSDVSNYVVDKIKEYGVAKQVVLEILEDENIQSLSRIDTFLQRVRRMGVRIAIDDFGTGYSNFSYLLKLQPDYIKIDGSLIKKLDTDTNSLAIVSAIIVFAKKLGIKTIAEYVHTKEVHDKCKELGIDEFQGFFLAEPSSRLYEN